VGKKKKPTDVSIIIISISLLVSYETSGFYASHSMI